ncbi:MAG: glycosyltransferase [Bacteroidales bacterium]|nr:glycosyltransferase [Bacteroidales bacterium]
MILTIAGCLVLFLTLLRFMVALVNMLSRPYLPFASTDEENLPSLSVLIPVRNEERNIGRLLGSLAVLPYRNAEILVYDDGSTDNSAEVIAGYTRIDKRVRCLCSDRLPEGWTGKNHACHRLAQEAKNDYLLFLDADVTVGEDLLRRAVTYAARHRLTLLSMFPRQKMRSRGEKIVVPFMFRILLSLLPLFLIRRCSWSSFSAANGQMMLFHGGTYRRYRFHERVRDRMAEDIEIMRLVKRLGYKGDTLVGRREIECRMYRGYMEGINGFSRNIFSMFGNSLAFLLLFAVTGLLGLVLLLFLPWQFAALYLLMVVGLNAMIAVTSRQRISENLLWLIPGIAAFYHITLLSLRRQARRNFEWKGRTIK